MHKLALTPTRRYVNRNNVVISEKESTLTSYYKVPLRSYAIIDERVSLRNHIGTYSRNGFDVFATLPWANFLIRVTFVV